MTVLLAAPLSAASSPVAVTEWGGLTVTWTEDLRTWNLCDPLGGVVLARNGVRGFSMPPVQRFTSSSPAVAGSRWRGRRTLEREVFLPLYVFTGAGSSVWLDLDAGFWGSMHPDRPGSLKVSKPDGTSRSLRLRYADDGEPAFMVDPSMVGWALYGVSLIAEQPFWEGEPVTRTFTSGAASDFFGAGAPPFTISSGSTLASATITNPGDEAVWPVWTLRGPFTSATVGVAGRSVAVPFALASGESLTIDTRPTAQTAITGAGVERTADLGAVQFAAIPPGDFVPLQLAVVGTGSVEVSVTPLWHRAW